ncbi:LysM peptidoglycan-binding domain-containing protein [Bacillota bacterium Meth-B3]|nr:LysM peptidoglycan-binding domain-containing protein [Christensenellaceae bacterium]MEA5065272.1 LysM peptidoglycan-binding domain-containing protein [Eubacteriales bacterium]MEA5069819.1 LysM peptidoglycan-binding domain-containing protein [Christensenellaceae bacterium]
MTVVRENEPLSALSARLGVPGCMLLRANRLYSPAWLLPGREIEVPDGDFCFRDGFPCPVGALHRPAATPTEDELTD